MFSQTNWHLALKYCRAKGLHLVTIDSKQENDALLTAMGRLRKKHINFK
jgi:hypothetical protein